MPVRDGGRGLHLFAEPILCQDLELRARRKDGRVAAVAHEVDASLRGNGRRREVAAHSLLPNDLAGRRLQAGGDATVGDGVQMRFHVQQRGDLRHALALFPDQIVGPQLAASSEPEGLDRLTAAPATGREDQPFADHRGRHFAFADHLARPQPLAGLEVEPLHHVARFTDQFHLAVVLPQHGHAVGNARQAAAGLPTFLAGARVECQDVGSLPRASPAEFLVRSVAAAVAGHHQQVTMQEKR